VKDFNDTKRRMKEHKYLLAIVATIVLIIILLLIIKIPREGKEKTTGPPRQGGGTTTGPPTGDTQVKKGLVVIYDVSQSIPELLMSAKNRFNAAINAANDAVDKLIRSEQIDPDNWETAEKPESDCLKGGVNKILLIKMGEPNAANPFFAAEPIELDGLRQKLPFSPSDFKDGFTYIELAKAVAAEFLESAFNQEGIGTRPPELYLLVVSDFQQSKLTRRSSNDWAGFVNNFDGKYNERKLLSANWKELKDFRIQLTKLERR